MQNYGCNGNLLCYHGVVERNRISSMQSHGKALEKECCLPVIFCDSGDTPANPLCELSGHLMPYSMYQLFLWQMGRRCVCWPIWSMSILFCAAGCHSNDCDVVVWERFCGRIVHAAHVHPLPYLLIIYHTLNMKLLYLVLHR